VPDLGALPFGMHVERALSTAVGWASRVRLPSRRSARRTLIVRSTSLGDFAVFLPFLASVQQLVGDEEVDLLTISRTGDIASRVLRASSRYYAVIDPRDGASLRSTIRLARERLYGRAYERVFFATQNSDAPLGQLRKLAMIRAVVGPGPRIIGMGRNAAVRTRSELMAANGIAENQATTPFLACRLHQLATREGVQALVARPDADGVARAWAAVGLPADDTQRPLIAFYVHAKDERKRWPLDRFVAAANVVLDQIPGSMLLLVGGPEDANASNHVAAQVAAKAGTDRVRVVAGRLDLPQLFMLLGRCRLFIGNDGAPVHYAALAGCRVVSIFCNWESAGLWEPIAAPASISIRPTSDVQGPSGFGITDIPVDEVTRAALTLWASAEEGHRVVVAKNGRRVAEHTLVASPLRSDSEAAVW
jgi:ADP-heptose:LPS heptosyltransferase